MLYRLADPGIPGTDKLNLVAGATAADAATLDKFAKALLDNGYTPPSFDATDLAWSDANPADVVATVTVNKPEPDGGFSIPMEFKPHQGGWQLSRETYDMLLNLGKTSAPTSPGPPG
ncbi:Putative lipoprotein LppK [Mycobacterium talmoniae]|uniref:Lipoprotein LppK n=1 Tax=Mycobacterium talmoniae TaxID=1858794 RepID=A0A2S8BCL9_9MYCO|nr:Putative lipoprotein LppK [Mycobacterium talmoniae]